MTIDSDIERPIPVKKNPAPTAASEPPSDLWSRLYAKHGELWKNAPSPAGQILIEKIGLMRARLLGSVPEITVFEAGYGYGRDAIPILNIEGALIRYKGIDPSFEGYKLAEKRLRPDEKARSLFMTGDFTNHWIAASLGKAKAFLSHRTIHLLGSPEREKAFLDNAFTILEEGGIAVISARDVRDFNPNSMEWVIKGKTARYTTEEKLGHEVKFFTAEELKEAFARSGFEVLETVQSSEPESILTEDQAKFTIIYAMKPQAVSL